MNKTQSFRADLAMLRTNQQFLAIAILFLVSVIVWVGYGLITSQQVVNISAEQKMLAQPLTPTLDISVVSELEQKPYFEPSVLNDFTIYKLVSLDDVGLERAVPIDTDISTLQTPLPTVPQTPVVENPAGSDDASGSGLTNP
jgi:hypothetical protein